MCSFSDKICKLFILLFFLFQSIWSTCSFFHNILQALIDIKYFAYCIVVLMYLFLYKTTISLSSLFVNIYQLLYINVNGYSNFIFIYFNIIVGVLRVELRLLLYKNSRLTVNGYAHSHSNQLSYIPFIISYIYLIVFYNFQTNR